MTRKKFSRLVSDISKKPIDTLKTEEINLFNFLALIVDIKHRVKYGCLLQDMNDKRITNESLPDQLLSVDNGLEGDCRRGISDAKR